MLTATIKGLAAGTVNTGLAILSGAALPAAGITGAMAIVGFFGIGVSLVLFVLALLVLALRHLGAARTGAYFSLAPFIVAVLAIGPLHETLTLNLVLAGLLMSFGLWMHLGERHDHEHEHEWLEHEHSHRHDWHHQHQHECLLRSRIRVGTAILRCATRIRIIRICIIGTVMGKGFRVPCGKPPRSACIDTPRGCHYGAPRFSLFAAAIMACGCASQ